MKKIIFVCLVALAISTNVYADIQLDKTVTLLSKYNINAVKVLEVSEKAGLNVTTVDEFSSAMRLAYPKIKQDVLNRVVQGVVTAMKLAENQSAGNLSKLSVQEQTELEQMVETGEKHIGRIADIHVTVVNNGGGTIWKFGDEIKVGKDVFVGVGSVLKNHWGMKKGKRTKCSFAVVSSTVLNSQVLCSVVGSSTLINSLVHIHPWYNSYTGANGLRESRIENSSIYIQNLNGTLKNLDFKNVYVFSTGGNFPVLDGLTLENKTLHEDGTTSDRK